MDSSGLFNPFKNDELIGNAKLFYENGNIMTLGYFVNNKLNGF